MFPTRTPSHFRQSIDCQQNNDALQFHLMRITFLGASRTVTGSKYLVETDKAKVLVDCGLFQGKKELRKMNWEKFPVDVRTISAVVLTHAHIDHIGYLPRLVRAGYKGPIYCTAPTKAFAELLLLDSAHLQEEEASFANRHGTSKHTPALPLYSERDVKETLPLFKTIPRDKAAEVASGIQVLLRCAGHILGAASIVMTCGGKAITFSGDIGRYAVPLLPDPRGTEIGDLLLCESTYGDREHDDSTAKKDLEQIIKHAVDQRGPLVIPAFALGRTQTLIYFISKLEQEGKIPILPVFVDSPMAVDATKIYKEFRHDFDEEAQEQLREGINPIQTQNTIFCRSVEDSKKINHVTGPRIIISASGMVTGGRILHHLRNHLGDETTTVLFAGFQAEGTRGHTILSGAPFVKIFGQQVPIRAHIKNMSSLSAHGDKNELIRWLKSCNGTPKQVRIVHGESSAADAFSALVTETFGWKSAPAEYLEVVEV